MFPKVLIISSKLDFSTDLITAKLRSNQIKYLRLNLDQLNEYKILLDPINGILKINYNESEFIFSENTLNSIYFRAPTFLRDIFQEQIPEEEQLFRTQWAAFIRSLILFEDIKWVNNPVITYKAEIKSYQLYVAKKIGFKVPETLISNFTKKINSENIVIKSIDTAILNIKDYEKFVYTDIINSNDYEEETHSSPFFIQEALLPKIDIRITVIEQNVIAIKIMGEELIEIDWRKYKNKIFYELFELPKKIKEHCLNLANLLGLKFCAIDLILKNGEYYFIEVNPTGEWAWLQKNTGVNFDTIIANCLSI